MGLVVFYSVTTFIDFADQTRGESPLKGFQKRRKTADGHIAIDYSLHVSKTDLEISARILTIFPSLYHVYICAFLTASVIIP